MLGTTADIFIQAYDMSVAALVAATKQRKTAISDTTERALLIWI